MSISTPPPSAAMKTSWKSATASGTSSNVSGGNRDDLKAGHGKIGGVLHYHNRSFKLRTVSDPAAWLRGAHPGPNFFTSFETQTKLCITTATQRWPVAM